MRKLVCPKCQGSKEISLEADEVNYSWNKGKTHKPCNNCGGQYQWGRATGKVSVRPDGEACLHEYTGKNIGRCLTAYSCRHCAEGFTIDSGD